MNIFSITNVNKNNINVKNKDYECNISVSNNRKECHIAEDRVVSIFSRDIREELQTSGKVYKNRDVSTGKCLTLLALISTDTGSMIFAVSETRVQTL